MVSKKAMVIISCFFGATEAQAEPNPPVETSISKAAASAEQQQERCNAIAALKARGSNEHDGAMHAAELATCAAIAAARDEAGAARSDQRKRIFERRLRECQRVPLPAGSPYLPEHFLVPLVLGALHGDPELGPDDDFLNLCRGYLQGRIDERDRRTNGTPSPMQ